MASVRERQKIDAVLAAIVGETKKQGERSKSGV
jgi:hypothetical protein